MPERSTRLSPGLFCGPGADVTPGTDNQPGLDQLLQTLSSHYSVQLQSLQRQLHHLRQAQSRAQRDNEESRGTENGGEDIVIRTKRAA